MQGLGAPGHSMSRPPIRPHPPHPPVQSDGSEAEHGDGAEKLVQELDGFAEEECTEPPAAARAAAQRHVEGHAHQGSADARARQVLDETPSDRLEDIGVAGTPKHRGIAWQERTRMSDNISCGARQSH